jgi:hypothetical protein
VSGEQRALLLQEVEQARHLLEIRWNVGIVASEMHIVELDVDYVLDAGAKVTCPGLRCLGFSRADGQEAHGQAHWRTCAD